MPTYEYKCDACGHAFERFHSMSAVSIKKCPECGKSRVKRLIGTGAGLIFKGSGFYITDYRDKSYADKAKSESGTSEGGATEGKSDAKPSDGAAAESKPASVGEAAPAGKSEAKSEPKSQPQPQSKSVRSEPQSKGDDKKKK